MLDAPVANMIRVFKPVSTPERTSCRLGTDEAWICAREGAIVASLRPNIEAFLPIAILLASDQGCDLQIDDLLEDGYFANLDLGFAPFVSAFYGGRRPTLHRSGKAVQSKPATSGKSALLFSGGVDSFYSLRRLLDDDIRPDYLINIDAGAHGTNNLARRSRLKNVFNVADKIGIPTVVIETNFHVLYRAPHVRCATIRNLAACLSLFPDVDTFYYSSAVAYGAVSFQTGREHGIHFIDHAVASNILPSGVRAIEIGYDATRLQKTAAIVRDDLSSEHLDVCTNAPYQADWSSGTPLNCGACIKCLRTIATLEYLGELERFESAFLLHMWRNDRRRALEMLKRSDEPLDQEVIELFGREIGSPRSRIVSRFWRKP